MLGKTSEDLVGRGPAAAKRLQARTYALGLELRSTTPSPACCTTCHGHARARSGGRKTCHSLSSCTHPRASLLEREA